MGKIVGQRWARSGRGARRRAGLFGLCFAAACLEGCGGRSDLVGANATAGGAGGAGPGGGHPGSGGRAPATCPKSDGPSQLVGLCRGRPDEEGCLEPPSCQGGGRLIELVDGGQVCDCPPGRWGSLCEVATRHLELGTRHACALLADGQARCWGANESGQAEGPSGGGIFQQLALGDAHTVALREDGGLDCFGPPADARCRAPSGGFRSVAAGADFSCVVRVNGELVCFGGAFDEAAPTIPGNFTKVVARGAHVCALSTEGAVRCFGQDEFSQRTPPAGPYRDLATGDHHACAIQEDGRLQCWGQNLLGEASEPPQVVLSLALGTTHSCGVLSDGQAGCWGSSESGRTLVPAGRYQSLASRSGFSCGVTTEGDVRCWGEQNARRLPPSRAYRALSVAGNVCVADFGGQAFCLDDPYAPTLEGRFVELAQTGDLLCGRSEVGLVSCAQRAAEPITLFSTPVSAFDADHLGVCALVRGGLDCRERSGAPLDFPGRAELARLDVGPTAVCVRDERCGVECFGSGAPLPPDAWFAEPWRSLALAERGGCSLDLDGRLACWGSHEQFDARAPSVWEELAVDASGVCGLSPRGALACVGPLSERADRGPFRRFGMSERRVCGLRADGRLSCSGDFFVPSASLAGPRL